MSSGSFRIFYVRVFYLLVASQEAVVVVDDDDHDDDGVALFGCRMHSDRRRDDAVVLCWLHL
jgi:hypothetical protein